jgi:hypothetical protein
MIDQLNNPFNDIALSLVTDYLHTAIDWAGRKGIEIIYGTPYQRAIEQGLKDGFTCLMRTAARGQSPAEANQIADVLATFLRQDTIRARLLEMAINGTNVDSEELAKRFHQSTGPDALFGIRLNLPHLFNQLQFDYTNAFIAAAKDDETLFREAVLQRMLTLQSLMLEMLGQNRGAAPTESLTWPLYINIPAPPTNFVGREDRVRTLIAQLCAGTTTALSAEGLPGVGKTTLAVKLAHHPDLRAHFTDGVLWAGLGPNGDPALALSRWADALQLDLSDKPTTAARAAAVADAISSRKLLIVLDDIWHLEHAQTLRLGGPGSVHLLTTRDQRIAAAFGHVATVDVLTPEAARALFQTLAPAAYNADPAAADALLDAVGYLPLAIELLAGYLNAGASKRFANRTRQALDELTTPQRRLALATRRLGSHESAAVTLQQTIALSLEGLAEEDETAVAVFHALGAFAPKPATFDLDAAIAVTGATDNTIALLADRNLLEIDGEEALSLHQTLADAARVETPAEAVTKHRDHYLALVNEDKEDWQTIGKIYPQIIYAWQHTPPDNPTKIAFVDSLFTYQPRQGFWQDRLSWLEQALQVAKLTNDQRSEARMLVALQNSVKGAGFGR